MTTTTYTQSDFDAPLGFWEWKEKQGISFALEMMKKHGDISAVEMHEKYLEEFKEAGI